MSVNHRALFYRAARHQRGNRPAHTARIRLSAPGVIHSFTILVNMLFMSLVAHSHVCLNVLGKEGSHDMKCSVWLDVGKHEWSL